MIKKLMASLALAVTLTACGANGTSGTDGRADSTAIKQQSDMQNPQDKYVELTTSYGNIVVRLYGDTPKHQENFLKLVNEDYYDGVLFHRVINEFMIQTGDPDSKTAKKGQALGSGGPGYQIDAEIVYPKHFHKRGALAAARTGDQVNPQRRSSGSQFYIVTGQKVPEAMMSQIEQQSIMQDKQNEFYRLANEHMAEIRAMQQRGDQAGLQALQQKLIDQVEAKYKDAKSSVTPEMKQAYTTVGGAPHLDNQYTVFGEVISGMDVVDKIEKVQTDGNDRPLEDVKILSAKQVDAPK